MAAWLWISHSSDLYKISYLGPYLLCVHPSLVEDVLFKIQEGMCALHSGERSLVHEPSRKDIGGLTCKKMPKLCPQVYQVPTFSPLDSLASKGLDPSHQSMALCPMGDGHSEGLAPSSREVGSPGQPNSETICPILREKARFGRKFGMQNEVQALLNL